MENIQSAQMLLEEMPVDDWQEKRVVAPPLLLLHRSRQREKGNGGVLSPGLERSWCNDGRGMLGSERERGFLSILCRLVTLIVRW